MIVKIKGKLSRLFKLILLLTIVGIGILFSTVTPFQRYRYIIPIYTFNYCSKLKKKKKRNIEESKRNK